MVSVPTDLVLGAGLYETVRVDEGRIRFGLRHVARLSASAQVLGLPVPTTETFVTTVGSARGGPVVRVTLHESPAGTALLAAAGRELGSSRALSLTALSGWYAPGYELREHKLTSHFHGVWARRCAERSGYDDALLVSRDGRVGETSNGNVAILEGDVLLTPPVDGLLPGIAREALLQAAGTIGISTREQAITLPQLAVSDGVFVTSAPRGLVEASELEGSQLRRAEPALVEALRHAIDEIARNRSVACP